MKQVTKLAIGIGLASACWINIGCHTREKNPQKPEKNCFSGDTLDEGTIFCDDFKSKSPFIDRYLEYDDKAGDFVRAAEVGRGGSAGMRVVWQKGEVGAGSLK